MIPFNICFYCFKNRRSVETPGPCTQCTYSCGSGLHRWQSELKVLCHNSQVNCLHPPVSSVLKRLVPAFWMRSFSSLPNWGRRPVKNLSRQGEDCGSKCIRLKEFTGIPLQMLFLLLDSYAKWFCLSDWVPKSGETHAGAKISLDWRQWYRMGKKKNWFPFLGSAAKQTNPGFAPWFNLKHYAPTFWPKQGYLLPPKCG